MTAADPRARLDRAQLYLCTDRRRDRGDLTEFLDTVLAAGVDVVQLREKGLEAQEEIEALAVVAAAADRHGALWAVNDRADVARVVEAPVLHLGQLDLPPAAARSIVGPEVALGRSTHDAGQLAAAIADPDVDYLCAGPVWATPTKPGRPAAGLDLVSTAAAAAPAKPWFAIGGIDGATLSQVLDRGATRVVVVRALTTAADPAAATAHLVRRLRAAHRSAQK